MKLVFAGTPEPAALALERLIASSHDVLAVLTRPDAPRGRGRTLHPSSVKEVALKHNIPVLTPSTLKAGTPEGDSVRASLAELQPDCIPVVAYGALIPQDLLGVPRHGWVNLHFSLLPRWRGAAPVQAALAAGDAVTGVSTFLIDAGLDTGDVLLRDETPIDPSFTADDLLTALAHQGSDLLVETMNQLEHGKVRPEPQIGTATYASKISVEDARVNWRTPADEIARRIRAFTPAPGAWTVCQGERYKLGPVTVLGTKELSPGEVRIEKKLVRVGTGTVDVLLETIQPPGKRRMDAAAWGRGVRGGNTAAAEEMRFE